MKRLNVSKLPIIFFLIVGALAPRVVLADATAKESVGAPALPVPFTSQGAQGFFMDWSDNWVLPQAGKGIVTMDVQMMDNFHMLFVPDRYLKNFQAVVAARKAYLNGVTAKAKKKDLDDLNKKANELYNSTKIQAEMVGFIGWPKKPNQSQLLLSGTYIQQKMADLPAGQSQRLSFVVDGKSKQFFVLLNNNVFMQQAYDDWLGNINRFAITSFDSPITVSNLQIFGFDELSPAEKGIYSLSNPAWKLLENGDGAVSFKAFGSSDITCLVGSYEIVLFGKGTGTAGLYGTESFIRKGVGGSALATVTATAHPAPGKEIDVLITLNKNLKKISVTVNGTVLMTAKDFDYDKKSKEFSFSSGTSPVAYSNIRSTVRLADPEEAAIAQAAQVAKDAADKAAADQAVADSLKAQQLLQAKQDKELSDLKARADVVADAAVSTAFVWKEAWQLPVRGSGIMRCKVHGDGNILIAVSEHLNDASPSYSALLFGGKGTRCELRSVPVGAMGPVVLVGIDKPNTNAGKETEVMLVCNRGTKTISVYANGDKLLEFVDPKYNMNIKYFGIAAAAGSVIYYDTAIVSVDARENFPASYQAEGEFSSHIAIGKNNGALEAWCIDEEKDASLKRFNQKSTAANPWVAVDVKDDTGAKIADIQDIAISSDGLMYLLDGAGKAYLYNWGTKVFTLLANAAGSSAANLEFISVGNKDAVYAVDVDTNTLYHYVKGAWQANTAVKAKHVSASQDGSVAIIIPDGTAFIKTEGKGNWVEITGGKVRRVAVASKNLIYGIDNAGQILKMSGGGWLPVVAANGKPAGIASEIAVNVDGSLLVTNSEMDIYSENIATILDDAPDAVAVSPVAAIAPVVAATPAVAGASVVAVKVPETAAAAAKVAVVAAVAEKPASKKAKQAVHKKSSEGKSGQKIAAGSRGKKARIGLLRSRLAKGRKPIGKRAHLVGQKTPMSKKVQGKVAKKHAMGRGGTSGKRPVARSKAVVSKKNAISKTASGIVDDSDNDDDYDSADDE